MDGMDFCGAGCLRADSLISIFSCLFSFRYILQHCLSIHYNFRDIGMHISDGKNNLAFLCFQRGLNKNTTENFAKGHRDFPLINKLLRADIVGRSNICQRLQTLIGISGNIAKSCGKNISHFFGIGNTAGKGVFIHTAVHSNIQVKKFALCIGLCLCHTEGNGSRFRYAQCRNHIFLD